MKILKIEKDFSEGFESILITKKDLFGFSKRRAYRILFHNIPYYNWCDTNESTSHNEFIEQFYQSNLTELEV